MATKTAIFMGQEIHGFDVRADGNDARVVRAFFDWPIRHGGRQTVAVVARFDTPDADHRRVALAEAYAASLNASHGTDPGRPHAAGAAGMRCSCQLDHACVAVAIAGRKDMESARRHKTRRHVADETQGMTTSLCGLTTWPTGEVVLTVGQLEILARRDADHEVTCADCSRAVPVSRRGIGRLEDHAQGILAKMGPGDWRKAADVANLTALAFELYPLESGPFNIHAEGWAKEAFEIASGALPPRRSRAEGRRSRMKDASRG